MMIIINIHLFTTSTRILSIYLFFENTLYSFSNSISTWYYIENLLWYNDETQSFGIFN